MIAGYPSPTTGKATVFQFQKISNYGTATPAVARTVLQGSDILQHFNVENEKRSAALLALQELQRHLLRCVAIADALASDIHAARELSLKEGLGTQSHGRAVVLPAVTDVQSRAESFLQSAKLAIAQTAKLTAPFFGIDHDHRYHKVADWALKQFGEKDPLDRQELGTVGKAHRDHAECRRSPHRCARWQTDHQGSCASLGYPR